jgi:ribosome-associated toxin RatA of RatAB toxin-antitoxin module
MHHVYKQASVPYSTQQMYDLVNNIADYPNFLPWCKHAHILAESAQEITAKLLLAKGGIHKAFTTRNTLTPNQEIRIALVDGPFKKLQGHWRFIENTDGSTLVSVELSFEFSSKLLAALLSGVFHEIANTLVSAFIQEAHRRYGA